MTDKTKELEDEIKKKFYKIKPNDKLTLTGKQLNEFAKFNRQQAKQEILEEVKIWLEEFEKLINWHKERSLLPYDWNDYEHKKIVELREKLGGKKK